ncbi:2011_t:CDS:2, partial [Funneliformis mosseae]
AKTETDISNPDENRQECPISEYIRSLIQMEIDRIATTILSISPSYSEPSNLIRFSNSASVKSLQAQIRSRIP